MTIERLIRSALSEIDLKNMFIGRRDEDLPALVYNYTNRPAYFADNQCKAEQYVVTVNILVKSNIESYKQQVKDCMEAKGFVHTLTSATYLEDSGYYNTPIQFNISLIREQ